MSLVAAQSVAFAGAKGGVGTATVVLGAAARIAEAGRRAVVVDVTGGSSIVAEPKRALRVRDIEDQLGPCEDGIGVDAAVGRWADAGLMLCRPAKRVGEFDEMLGTAEVLEADRAAVTLL